MPLFAALLRRDTDFNAAKIGLFLKCQGKSFVFWENFRVLKNLVIRLVAALSEC